MYFIPSDQIHDNDDGSIRVSYTTEISGPHRVTVLVDAAGSGAASAFPVRPQRAPHCGVCRGRIHTLRVFYAEL